MAHIPDILYVFVFGLALLGADVARPSPMLDTLLTTVAGALVGIATRSATAQTQVRTIEGDVNVRPGPEVKP